MTTAEESAHMQARPTSENEVAPGPGEGYAPEREIRLAVVMYGGVSLAIYMYGVAQELLNLVKATAPAEPGSSDPGGLAFAEDETTPCTEGSRDSWDAQATAPVRCECASSWISSREAPPAA